MSLKSKCNVNGPDLRGGDCQEKDMIVDTFDVVAHEEVGGIVVDHFELSSSEDVTNLSQP